MAAAKAIRKRRPYCPGQNAPVTGIYHVHHATGHRDDHDAVIIRGEVLPACRFCKAEVQYAVKEQASHITHDIDFTGPTTLILARTTPPIS